MITGRHTCIHLISDIHQIWSTLKNPPTKHDDHVNKCDLHLVYLGFGAFIRLVPRQVPDDKDFVILSQITSDDPSTSHELNFMAINRQQIGDYSNLKPQHHLQQQEAQISYQELRLK